MYALWRHPSCLHTLFIIVSSRVSLFRPFSPYSGLGSSSSHAEFVVVERLSSPNSGLGSSSSHAELVVATRPFSGYSGLGSSSSHAKFIVAKSLENAQSYGH
jgi:hypothetical protein